MYLTYFKFDSAYTLSNIKECSSSVEATPGARIKISVILSDFENFRF